ncbi:hypothetical protein L1785_11445 [Antribacter sp. KLBMP9083]|uniref:N-acetyltransferase domain-containing protein n=1 Tax=Antribacter soli TaxID=2910976 RepID=A0AA41QEC8_9MICO|nr:hypothetical protein [Antribacter soli]MCF4121597.1 hypothetical protein [Antribacter soli]
MPGVDVDERPGDKRPARALYEALFARLRRRGYRRAAAGVALPYDASVAMHLALGFREVGVFDGIGWKLGGWRDVARFQLDLVPGAPLPDGVRVAPVGPGTDQK